MSLSTKSNTSWEKFCPTRIHYPFGYFCEIRVVSQQYLNKLAEGQVWGMSFNFGEKIGKVRMHRKEARIYLSRDMDGARFIETLRHEMDHNFTEYKGILFDVLKDKVFNGK